MKVVKNDCYGGFQISTQAQRDMIEMGCKHLKPINLASFFPKAKSPVSLDSIVLGDRIALREYAALTNMYCDIEHQQIYEATSIDRTCEHLIKLIEEKGSEYCSGNVSHLVVVEIPDNVCFEIEDYDGMESIVECHKIFG